MDKQRILDEIRRTATANGGQALGRARFEKETGITEGDWAGRYWARWSEAVEEAGFSPNRMNVRTDSDVVIGHLVGLIQRLKRFPVIREMRLHKRKHPDFPNERVFERFGSKAELRNAVIEYCKRHNGFRDVQAICQTEVPSAEEEPRDENPFVTTDRTTTTKEGYVYLAVMKVGRERRHKVGNTVLVSTVALFDVPMITLFDGLPATASGAL